MEIKLTIKAGYTKVEVTIEGYLPMAEHLLEAIKKAAYEKDKYCEIK